MTDFEHERLLEVAKKTISTLTRDFCDYWSSYNELEIDQLERWLERYFSDVQQNCKPNPPVKEGTDDELVYLLDINPVDETKRTQLEKELLEYEEKVLNS